MTQHPIRSRRSLSRSIATATALLGVLLALAGPPAAAASEWRWTVTPYAWATDVGAEVRVGDRQLDATIAVEDLLDEIDTTFQVQLEAQRGAHGVVVDVFDVVLSEPYHRVELPGGALADTLLGHEIGMTLLDVAGLYDPRGDQQGLSFLYGARMLDQRVTLDALDLGTNETRRREVDDTLVDALVGVRFDRRLSRRWSVQARADVSTGGTELTWSAGSTVTCALGRTDRYALALGYRYLVVDFDTLDAVDVEMTLSGFLAGLRIRF